MAKKPTQLAVERSETAFADFKRALSPAQALAEANRCLYCHAAPCTTACPTEIDVPEFIRKIATGNLKGSARTIFASNVLGMSCARVCPVETLCAGSCVYNEQHSAPIAIGKLQRFATDAAFDQGWRFFEAGPETGKSVGLIGGGPASLAAAHELRRLGHACTIYERREVLGGLNTWGVAPYKLQADRAVEEIEWVLAIGGIAVETGVEIGASLTWAELAARHDALFVGVGLGEDRWLQAFGGELEGVVGAVAFIERMKLGKVELADVGRAVVVGGGNTAVDAVRELRGLGVEDVTLVYRRGEAAMAGYAHEWQAAKQEGVKAEWNALPIGVEGNGRVERVRCQRLDAELQPIPAGEVSLPADLVLLAIGQSPLDALVAELDGVRLAGGRVAVDANGATGRPGVFAGGDCVNGGKEVVNAVAEGRAAARGIDAYLRGASDG